MIQYAKQLRSPAMVAVLIVLAVYAGLSVGQFVVLVGGGAALAQAAQDAGSSSPSLVWVFLAVALALTCLFIEPRTKRASALITAGAVVMTVIAVEALALWVFGLIGPSSVGKVLGAVGGIMETLVKAACAVVLWRLRPARGGASSGQPPAGGRGQDPLWRAEEAVGLQWARAGDAASGASATGPVPPPVQREPGQPDPPGRRQLWPRGGVGSDLPADEPPDESSSPPARGMPWTTASEAADGYLAPGAGADASDQPPQPRREPPTWTPITHTE